MKKFGLSALCIGLLGILIACGDQTRESSELNASKKLEVLDSRSAKDLRLDAKVSVDPKAFNKSNFIKGERLVYSNSSTMAQRLRRDIKCSDDGRLCFECYYKSNGELLYCDIWILPKVSKILWKR